MTPETFPRGFDLRVLKEGAEMSIGLWQLILGIIILVVPIVLPIVSIYTENSKKRLSRRIFTSWLILWLLAFLAAPMLGVSVSESLDAELDERSLTGTVLAAFGVGIIILQIMLPRQIVQRARDAGYGKRLAYLYLVPFVSIGLIIYLLFKRSFSCPSDRLSGENDS
jgi:uncharacterized membrane protein YhaH (DUF805 family)